MKDKQERLEERFAGLRDARSFPVFFIEHGMDGDERELLSEQVRSAASEHTLDSRWWDTFDLLLIVVATEVGYRYRGNGTDFWPVLEDEVGVPIGTPQRRNIRRLFARAAGKYGGAEPPSTPWAQAFHLIAWPITHALVPLELHRPLATTLVRLRHYATDLDDTTLHRAIKFAAGNDRPRFRAMLDNPDVIIPVVRSLVQPKAGEGFSTDTMQRISVDLEQDNVAAQRVRAARKYQANSSRRRDQTVPARPLIRRLGSLFLTRVDGTWALEATLPPLPPTVTPLIRRVLRRRRFAASLWGASQAIPSEQLLSGLRFRFSLEHIPDPETPLFHNLDGIEFGDEVVEALSSFELPISEVMLFAVSASDDLGRFVAGPSVSAYRKYWALVPQGGGTSTRAMRIGRVGPYDCHLVDPEDEDQQAFMADLGYDLRHDLSIDVIGPPPLRELANGHEYLEGDRIYLVTKRAPTSEYRIVQGEVRKVANVGEAVEFSVEAGENVARFESGDLDSSVRWIGSSNAPPMHQDICSIESVSTEQSVAALLRGELSFLVSCHAPLESVDLRVDLSGDGWHRTSWMSIQRLPATIHSSQPVFKRVVEAAGHRAITDGSDCRLRLTVGDLVSRGWTLEARTRPCWWERDGEEARLVSDLGDLKYGAIPASSPCDDPGDSAHEVAREPVLLVPMELDVLDFGFSADFATLCIAPTSGALSADPIDAPRHRRARETRDGRLGLEALTAAYLKWAVAQTWTPLAELRRHQVASEIDRWIARLSCGDSWVETEGTLKFQDPWRLLEERAHAAALGRDSYPQLEDIPVRIWGDVLRYAVRLVEREQPAFWGLARAEGGLKESDWLAVEAACNTAYEAVAARLEKEGRDELAKLLRSGDASADFNPEAWSSTVMEVLAENDLADLAAKIFPSDSVGYFLAIEPSGLSLNDMSEELHRWAESNSGAFFRSVPDEEDFKTLVAIWTEPEVAVTRNWRGVTDLMVVERSACRAARYLALKVRQGRMWEAG